MYDELDYIKALILTGAGFFVRLMGGRQIASNHYMSG